VVASFAPGSSGNLIPLLGFSTVTPLHPTPLLPSHPQDPLTPQVHVDDLITFEPLHMEQIKQIVVLTAQVGACYVGGARAWRPVQLVDLWTRGHQTGNLLVILS